MMIPKQGHQKTFPPPFLFLDNNRTFCTAGCSSTIMSSYRRPCWPIRICQPTKHTDQKEKAWTNARANEMSPNIRTVTSHSNIFVRNRLDPLVQSLVSNNLGRKRDPESTNHDSSKYRLQDPATRRQPGRTHILWSAVAWLLK
jgi:hypothetical protein